ncbi:SEC14 cytosolic factor [Penicillium rolfsii]|nr:SEC14 cytosolic factor [Penicillium rolfsii]
MKDTREKRKRFGKDHRTLTKMLWRTKSHTSQAASEQDLARTASASKNDLSASASQAAGTAWLAGHLNHLTPEQEEKFVEFKGVCAERKYYTPAVEAAQGVEAVPASHDDATMLRFLRARKFDVEGAWGQFKDTEDWRKENAIEALYANINVDSYEAARRMYPQWTGRRDRRGIPVYVFEIRHLNSKEMAAYNNTIDKGTPETHKSSTVPARLLNLFALYENLINFVMPLCTALPRPNPETPIVTSTNIVDVSGVGLKQFWNLKGHMQDASVLATAHYPETLDRIFIIGAPSFFPTVWGWIKRWFDPVTTSKIFILSSAEVQSTLTSFMDPSSFPKQYGGELDWKWGDMPNLDEPARELLQNLEQPPAEGKEKKDILKGPILFKGGKIEVLGTEDGKERRQTISVPQVQAQAHGNGTAEPVKETSENEKAGLDNVAVNVNQVASQEGHTTTAAAAA